MATVYRGVVAVEDIVIAAAASVSATIDLTARRWATLSAIQMPAAWTAAALTFEVSHDGAAWVPLFHDSEEYTEAAEASRGVNLNAEAFRAWPYARVRSGTLALPVEQVAERTLLLLKRP